MKKTMSAFAATAAVLVMAGSAGAQVCAGFPTNDGQGTLGALANFPDGFDQYGAEGSVNVPGPLAVNAGYIHSTGGTVENTFRGGLALDIGSFMGGILPGLSICPNVRADYSSEDGTTRYTVPIGLGLGATLPVGGPDMTLTPYVIPAFVWQRSELGVIDDSDTNFGVRGGADLNFDRFFLGGTVEWVDTPSSLAGDSKAIFGVRAGFKF